MMLFSKVSKTNVITQCPIGTASRAAKQQINMLQPAAACFKA